MTDPAFIKWLNKAGYITATSDIQLALFDAWSAGAYQPRTEITTLASGDKLPPEASNNAKIVEAALKRGRDRNTEEAE